MSLDGFKAGSGEATEAACETTAAELSEEETAAESSVEEITLTWAVLASAEKPMVTESCFGDEDGSCLLSASKIAVEVAELVTGVGVLRVGDESTSEIVVDSNDGIDDVGGKEDDDDDDDRDTGGGEDGDSSAAGGSDGCLPGELAWLDKEGEAAKET